MTEDQIAALDARALSAIIRSTNRHGRYAQELVWAKQEADRRYCRPRLCPVCGDGQCETKSPACGN